MAIADHSIDPKILSSARTEFLLHGFEKASLKAICQGAGVTTGPYTSGTRARRSCSAPW